MPVEWLIVGAALVVWGLYHYLELPMPGQPGDKGPGGPFRFYLKQVYASFYLYALMFLGVVLGATWRMYLSPRSVSSSKVEVGTEATSTPQRSLRALVTTIARRFEPKECLYDARLLHCVVVMFVEFQLLKHLIPHLNPTLYDNQFSELERWICGTSCGHLLYTFLGSGAVRAASQHYTWYFPYMIGMVLVMLASVNRRLHHEYVLAFILLFLVGILWVYAIPTLGPTFYLPELYSFVRETESGFLQQDLWGMREALAHDPLAKGVIFSISGFPSLHVAVVLLGTLYAFRVHYHVGLLSSSFLLLIIHSTIILGWHYVLDDVGSCFLVALCIWIARRFPWGEDAPLNDRA